MGRVLVMMVPRVVILVGCGVLGGSAERREGFDERERGFGGSEEKEAEVERGEGVRGE